MKTYFDNEVLQPNGSGSLQTLIANHSEFKKFLVRRLPMESVAEDILQQCFVRALEKYSALRNEEGIVAWFHVVLKNALIDYYRARASESDKCMAYLGELTALGGNKVTAMDEIEAVVCACIHRLLPNLKPAYAEVLKRIDLDGEAVEAVANDLGTNVNNLTVRLYRARKALKASLKNSCGTCTEHGCLDCTCE